MLKHASAIIRLNITWYFRNRDNRNVKRWRRKSNYQIVEGVERKERSRNTHDLPTPWFPSFPPTTGSSSAGGPGFLWWPSSHGTSRSSCLEGASFLYHEIDTSSIHIETKDYDMLAYFVQYELSNTEKWQYGSLSVVNYSRICWFDAKREK